MKSIGGNIAGDLSRWAQSLAGFAQALLRASRILSAPFSNPAIFAGSSARFRQQTLPKNTQASHALPMLRFNTIKFLKAACQVNPQAVSSSCEYGAVCAAHLVLALLSSFTGSRFFAKNNVGRQYQSRHFFIHSM